MAILRKIKKSDYTVIDNNIFKNKQLTIKAKGLLCTMLSLPDDWNFSEEGLTQLSNDSRTSIRSTIQELQEFGYLTRSRKRDEKGILGEAIYTIYEEPMYQNPTLEKPTLEKPMLENVHNKIINNKTINNNININNKEIYKESFEEIWELYPNKKGKTNSYKDFVKALKDGVPIEDIKQGLENYLRYIEIEKIEPRYIKNGSTWFHQRCWEDDYTIKRKLTTKDLASKLDFTDFLDKGRK